MAARRALVKEFLRLVNSGELKNLRGRKISVNIGQGYELELRVDVKTRKLGLRLVKD